MAITNGYATLAELRAKIDYTTANTSDDTELEDVIEAASRNIDQYCRRIFYQDDAATKYYTAEFKDRLFIDDIRTFTTVTIDGVTWTKDSDFYARPYNPINGEPWTSIEPDDAQLPFPVGEQRACVITGDFGWAAVPPEVKEACLLEASRLHARRTAPFGVAGNTDMGVAFLGAVNDPQARVLLQPLVRHPYLS